MSTGAKIGIGVGGCLGLIVVAIVLIVVIALLPGTDDTGSASPSPSATQEQAEEETAQEETAQEETTQEDAAEDEPESEQSGVSMTASSAGTAGDLISDTVYTVLDIEITNNSDEGLSVVPLHFTAVLSDGTERNDWEETVFADIQQFEQLSVQPGSSFSGQIAVVGEVVVSEVRYDPSFGEEEPIVAVVE